LNPLTNFANPNAPTIPEPDKTINLRGTHDRSSNSGTSHGLDLCYPLQSASGSLKQKRLVEHASAELTLCFARTSRMETQGMHTEF
jgi:hypothetical protein